MTGSLHSNEGVEVRWTQIYSLSGDDKNVKNWGLGSAKSAMRREDLIKKLRKASLTSVMFEQRRYCNGYVTNFNDGRAA